MGAITAPMTNYAANIPRLRALLALRESRDSNAPDVRSIIEQEEGPLISFAVTYTSDVIAGWQLTPPMRFKCAVAETLSGWCIVLSCGVQIASVGQAVWDSYLAVNEVSNPPRNGFLIQQGQYLADGYALVPSTAPRFIGIGHSAGCGVVFHAYQRLWNIRPSIAHANFIFYGSPRFSAERLFSQAPIDTIRHWMNDDDPVPFIPPVLPNWQRIWAGLSLREANRLTNFVACPGGVVINVLGEPALSENPTNIGPSPPDAIGQWLAAVEQGRTTSHSLEAYLARFLAGSNIPAVVDQPLLGTSSGGDWSPQTLTDTRRRIEAATSAIILSTERNVGEAQTVIPPTKIFKAFRRGRIWYVSFNGVQIATAPNKKRARGMARVGNDFLRRLLIEHQVEGTALTSQLGNWITEASSDNGGYFPTLNNAG